MKLNRKHMHFIDAFMATNNAAEAARQAGYSEGNAKQQGRRLLKDPDIQAEIERRAKERSDKYKMDADRIMQELVDLLEIAKAEVKPKLNSKTGNPIKDENGNPVYVVDGNLVLKTLVTLGKLKGVDAFGTGEATSSHMDRITEEYIRATNERYREVREEKARDEAGYKSSNLIEKVLTDGYERKIN